MTILAQKPKIWKHKIEQYFDAMGINFINITMCIANSVLLDQAYIIDVWLAIHVFGILIVYKSMFLICCVFEYFTYPVSNRVCIRYCHYSILRVGTARYYAFSCTRLFLL